MKDAAFTAWVHRARAVPIAEVLASRGIRLTTGSKNEPHGPCPRCAGEDRFYVRLKQQRFFCRQCTPSGGDVIDLVQWLDGCDFLAACETLTGKQAPPRKGNGLAGAAAHKIVVAEFRYEDEAGDLLFVVERIEYLRGDGSRVLTDGKVKKTFRQKRPDPTEPDRWIYSTNTVRVVPYHLPGLIEALALGQTIFIVEGERKAEALSSWNVPATCNAMGAGKWKAEHSAFLKDADVVLIPDADEAGFKHAHAVGAALNGIAKRVRVLVLPGLRPKGDIIDWIGVGGTREQLEALVAEAPLWMPPLETDKPSEEQKAKAEADEQRLIHELAQLSRTDYERRRRDAARNLGIRAGALDDEVEARRRQHSDESGPAPLFGHWVVEPWPEPVDTDALLLQIQRRLRRHIVFGSADQASSSRCGYCSPGCTSTRHIRPSF
jgi:DNA primase